MSTPADDKHAGAGLLLDDPPALLAHEAAYDFATGGYREVAGGPLVYGSVEVEVGRLWRALTRLLRPRRVLETGTHLGYSTTCIALALREMSAIDGLSREVVSMDCAMMPHLWEGHDVAKFVRWMHTSSIDAVNMRDARVFGTGMFDLLVLDSDHAYETIIFELIAFEPLLRPGGAILLHDSLYFDGVGHAVRQLMANPRFECVTLPSPRTHEPPQRCPGVTLVYKRRDGEPRLRQDDALVGKGNGDAMTPPLLRSLV